MALKKLIIHIGRAKSGSSSLQHWLTDNHALLSSQGILYPKDPNGRLVAHHPLALQLNPRETDGQDLETQISEIRRQVQDHETLLLSSEAFQNIADPTRLNEFLTTLNVPDIQVVDYVREHLDMAMSSYRQFAQVGRKLSGFADYCQKYGNMSSFVELWRNIGDLSLSWYDRSLLRNGDVVCDFCTRVGIEADDYRTEDKNPSIGGTLLALQVTANNLDIVTAKYKRLGGLAGSEKRFRSTFYISDEAAAKLRAGSVYNRSLVDALGEVPLKSWSSSPKIPDPATLETDLALIEQRLEMKVSAEHRQAIKEAGPLFELT